MHACAVDNRGPLLARIFQTAPRLPSSLNVSLRRHPPSYPQGQQNRLEVRRSADKYSEQWKLFAGEDDAVGSPPDAARSITEKQAQSEGMRNADTVLASEADVEAAGGKALGLDKQDALSEQPEQLVAAGPPPIAPVRQAAAVSARARLTQVDIDLKTVQGDLEGVTGEWRAALDAWEKADATHKGDALVKLQLLDGLCEELAGKEKELLALQGTLVPLAVTEAEAEATAARAKVAVRPASKTIMLVEIGDEGSIARINPCKFKNAQAFKDYLQRTGVGGLVAIMDPQQPIICEFEDVVDGEQYIEKTPGMYQDLLKAKRELVHIGKVREV